MANVIVATGSAHAADPVAEASATTTPAAGGETVLGEVVVRADSEKSKYQTPRIDSREYPEPVLNTPQTINIIPEALIQDQNATSLRDALRNVPGISFQAGEGGVPAGDALTIRGFSARTDIFIDGIRDIGGYSRDTFNLEQIEVVKGPASAFVGRGSTGGIINMATKSPKTESFYEGSFGIGTNDYYRLTVDVNQAVPASSALGIEGVAVRFNGLFHTQQFANRNFVNEERWGIAPSIAFGLGTPTRVILSYQHLEEDNLPSYGVPFVTTPVNPYGGKSAVGKPAPVANRTFFGLAKRDYEEIQNDVITLDIEHDLSDDITISNQTRYGRTYRDSIISAPRLITNNPNPRNGPVPFGINRQIQSRDQLDSIVANLTTLNAEFETWNIGHELVAAAEYNYEYESNYLRGANPLFTIPNADPALPPTPFFAQLGDPYDPNAYDRYSKPIFRTGARNVAESQSAALSVFDNITLSEHWMLNLGFRMDYFSTEYDQRDAAGVTTEYYQDEWQPTWRTGIVFKPVPSASIYFSYGTSFNPSAENLTLSAGNVNLSPEESSSFEIGAKWDLLDNKLSLSGAVFRINKENARTTDPITGIITTSGQVYVQGIEIGIAGNITDEWALYAGYCVLQSKITEDSNPLVVGNELPNTPEQTANFWTTYSLPFGVQIGTGVSYVDSRYANTLNDRSAPGYILQDAMISYEINEHATVQLNVANMWNEEYIDRVGGGHAIPGVGRTFIVSTRLQF